MNRRRAQSSVRWILAAAIGASVLVAGAYAVLHFSRPQVTVTEAIQSRIVQAFYSTGTVSPEREYVIKANVAGTLTERYVDKGDAVKKGQALGVVAAPELILNLEKAKAELSEKLKLANEADSPILLEFDARIKADTEMLAVAQRDEQRITDLISRDAGSQTDLDRAIDRARQVWSDVETAKAQRQAKKIGLDKDVEVAKATLAIAEWYVDQQTLKSPIDGVVLDWPIGLNTRLAINDPIMRVADVSQSQLVMRANVDEEDISKVHEGQLVHMKLYAFRDEVFEGAVRRIYDQADPSRRTFEVDVQPVNIAQILRPGMTGELNFVEQEKENVIVIPSQAVQNNEVWHVQNGKLAKSIAQIGIRGVEQVEVLSGLQAGDRVVISPILGLSEGQRVRADFLDPHVAAGLNKPKEPQANFKGF